MSKEIKIFKVLSNPRRFRIIGILLGKEKASVSNIAKQINLSFKSTSKHLCLLESAGLVKREQDGPFAFYRVPKDLKIPFRKLLDETASLKV